MGIKEWFAGVLGRAQTEAAKAAAEKALDKAGNDLADGLEVALLGKKGAADEQLAKDSGDKDALEAVRKQYGLDDKPEDRAAKTKADADDREARARAELAELKKQRGT